jgi:hypothetical protein
MTSTKVMLSGILIMLAGFALDSAATRVVWFKTMGADATDNLAYFTLAVLAVGFVVAVVGLFRR